MAVKISKKTQLNELGPTQVVKPEIGVDFTLVRVIGSKPGFQCEIATIL